jgi:hypothetical protein
MLRAIRSVVGATAVLIGGALLAQPPGGGDSYFPTKNDTRWTYKVGDNLIKVKLNKKDKVNNEDTYELVTMVGDEPKTTEMYVVRPDGVYRTKVKDDKLDPPVKVLPTPVKKDATWDVNTKIGTQTVKGTMKIEGVAEKVKVGAGDFETVHVVGKDLDIAGNKTTVSIWFARDRGIVKQEFKLVGGETVTLELQKFEEGKDGK